MNALQRILAPGRALVAWALAATLLALPALGHEGKLTFAPVLRDVAPAVVNISVESSREVRNPWFNDPRFRRFFGIPEDAPQQMRRRAQNVGSGVIIDAGDGLVVTNQHLVHNSERIRVSLKDGRSFDAELVGSDPGTDVALLRIEAEELTQLPLAEAESLEVGDFVIAIGNPFRLEHTVTAGIVSALGRTGLIRQGYEDFIQTDASINPGNSGGALVDLDGRLVGINTAIFAPSGGGSGDGFNVGIGFAVPVHIVRGVIDQLVEFGEVRRGLLGVMIEDVTPELREALDLADDVTGAWVARVVERSAAQEAGIQEGDIITALDGEDVETSAELRNRVGLMRAGDAVTLGVLREGDERLRIKATIGEPERQTIAGASSSPKLEGVELSNLTGDHERFGTLSGVEVASIERDSHAWRSGLRQGDVVLSVNRRPVGSVEEFDAVTAELDGLLALRVQRGESRLFIMIR